MRVSTGLALVLAAACSTPESDPPPGAADVDTLASGAVRVVNAPRPSWTPDTAWLLEEEFRLGTVEGGGPEQLSQVAGLRVDSLGRLFVLDFPAQEIRVFERDGSYSHTIGQKGQGPGELLRAAGMNMGPDGRLRVWDPGNNRLSVFELDGTFVTSHRRQVRGVVYPWRGEFTPDGHLIDLGVDHLGLDPGSGRSPTATAIHPIRLTHDFEILDTLPRLYYERELTPDGRGVPFGRGISSYLDRSGSLWFAHTKEYTVHERTLEGDTLLVFSLDIEPPPVTPADRDSILGLYEGRSAASRPSPDDFPPTKPVVRRIFGDNAGHLFVIPDLEDHPAGSRLDVFTTDGRYLGRLELPHPATLPYPSPWATDDRLFVVWGDDFNVPRVSAYRIVKP